jgi:hypothetical protein
MKVCTQCKAPKELTEFNKQKRSLDGHRGICKNCRHEKEYLPVADEKKAAIKFRYETDEAFRQLAKDKAGQQYLADKPRSKERSRKSTLGRYFGMTVEKYQQLEAEQGGRCAICNRKPEESDPRRKQLCVDHDHACCPGVKSCGKCIRALICSNCNSALGHFQDSIERLESATDYIKHHKAKHDSTVICINDYRQPESVSKSSAVLHPVAQY